jgi:hypothetical protein
MGWYIYWQTIGARWKNCQQSHICHYIVCFNLEAKTKNEGTSREDFFLGGGGAGKDLSNFLKSQQHTTYHLLTMELVQELVKLYDARSLKCSNILLHFQYQRFKLKEFMALRWNFQKGPPVNKVAIIFI